MHKLVADCTLGVIRFTLLHPYGALDPPCLPATCFAADSPAQQVLFIRRDQEHYAAALKSL
jgi:hypothetical protein